LKLLKIISEIKQLNIIPFKLPNNLDQQFNSDEIYPLVYNKMPKELSSLNPQFPEEMFKLGEFYEDIGDDKASGDMWEKDIVTYGEIIKSYGFWLPYYCFNHKYGYDAVIPKNEFFKFQSSFIEGKWIIYDYTNPETFDPKPYTLDEIKQATVWDLDKPGIDPNKIQVGDFLTFTLFLPTVEKFKQQVIEITAPEDFNHRYFKVKDIPGGGEDRWADIDLKTQHKFASGYYKNYKYQHRKNR
jgi:hypothetical protein